MGFVPPPGDGLVRSRLLHELRSNLDHPLTLLVAPAGSGKTTALHHLAADLDRMTATYRPTAPAADPTRLLADLHAALSSFPGFDASPDEPWRDARSALRALHTRRGQPAVLLVDDLHAITQSPAEAVLEQVVRGLPDWLRIVAASRRAPEFNLSDLLVTGRATQVPEDALRWRPWEVEQLFRDVYHHPLRPEQAARLCHRTEGWSAGLHLFHLASSRLGEDARQRLITELHTTPALVRDYLTRNVLEGLSDDLAEFMLDTCVLGRLDVGLCDRLRERRDSATHLDHLRSQRLFVVECEDGRGMRYHGVLRSYLEASLLERDGGAEVRRRQLRAGLLLEDVGALTEALHVYVRSEAWSHAERVVEAQGPGWLTTGGRPLLDRLPPAFVQSDPWLQVARARVLVGEGQLRRALGVYERAERSFGRETAGDLVRRELRTVRSWLAPRGRPPRSRPSHSELLQAALRSDPEHHARLAAADGSGSGLLVASAAMLLAGSVDEARRLAARAATAEDSDLLHLAIARVLESFADVFGGGPHPLVEMAEAAESFERLGIPWAGRLVRTVVRCLEPHDAGTVARTWRGIDPDEDPWGGPVLGLLGGIAAVVAGGTDGSWLEESAEALDRLHAPVPATWARVWAAVARARTGDEEAGWLATQARAQAHALQVPGAEAVAECVLAARGGPLAADSRDRAEALAAELGLGLPEHGDRPPVRVVERVPSTSSVRCFGGLQVGLDGRVVDLDPLRPQARQVLAMLAVRAPRPVHRERLAEALWPSESPATHQRRLPVLISTLRRHLEPEAEAGDWAVLVRVGDAYALRVPDDGWIDVATFEEAVAAARTCSRTDLAARRQLLEVAFQAYGGDLLPEFGAATWVVAERDHHRMEFVDVAQALAGVHLERGDTGATIEVVRAGIWADRYRSELWELLATAHRRHGDVAAAVRAEQEHREVLGELGLAPPRPVTARSGTPARSHPGPNRTGPARRR